MGGIGLSSNEYIVAVTAYIAYYDIFDSFLYGLSQRGYIVNALSFKTNLGRVLGPCGKTKGYVRKEITTMKAPEGYGLKGIFGREGKYLHAIGFHWCDILSDEHY